MHEKERKGVRAAQTGGKMDFKQKNMQRTWPKMKGGSDGEGWRGLWLNRNVEQVRVTIDEHGVLEHWQRIMGYGTRHTGHIQRK